MTESHKHSTEIEVIDAYKKTGDLELLGKLYKPYMHLVYGVSLKYFKNKPESQDAVMQIFEKLIETIKKHEITNFKSWLYVMTKNHCLMALRSKQYKVNQKHQEIDESIMESSIMLHHTDDEVLEDNLSMLEKCINELQNEQKRCVELFYLEKKPYLFIAERTGFEMKKVKSFIQNGKRNLKICMEKQSV
jgi:RNA polymerase sigma factor (sigma-70 family)